MSASTLSQVLHIFEQAEGALSLAAIARHLDVSQAQLDSMIQYWIRKGRIRAAATEEKCGSCGIKGDCPFVMTMPRSYELVPTDGIIPLHDIGPSCDRGCGCS